MKPTHIVFKESLAQSLLSDFATFAFLLLCVYVSRDSNTWTFISGVLFLVFLVAKASWLMGSDRVIHLYSLDELEAYVRKERGEQK